MNGEVLKNVSVYNEKLIFIDKKTVHRLVRLICDHAELSIRSLEFNFVSTETIEKINRKYLKHNYATDIITFDYSDQKNNLDGEIFISFDDAAENSKVYRVSVDNELLRLIIHGILHLIGYDDTTPAKRKKMKELEDEFVNKFQKFSKGLTLKK